VKHFDFEAGGISKGVHAALVIPKFKVQSATVGDVCEEIVYRVEPIKDVGDLEVMSGLHIPSQSVRILVSSCDLEYSLVHGLKRGSEHLGDEEFPGHAVNRHCDSIFLSFSEVVPLLSSPVVATRYAFKVF